MATIRGTNRRCFGDWSYDVVSISSSAVEAMKSINGRQGVQAVGVRGDLHSCPTAKEIPAMVIPHAA